MYSTIETNGNHTKINKQEHGLQALVLFSGIIKLSYGDLWSVAGIAFNGSCKPDKGWTGV